jgi:polyisoprenoid-binding protein YceI
MSVAEVIETSIPAGTWSIDPSHSAVEFAIKHIGIATVKGRAVGVTGTIEGGATPAVSGVVDATTLTTHDESRDGHLRAPDFFDVERYPELTFESTAVENRRDEIVVTGDLTIKGVSQPIELRGRYTGAAVDPWGNERVGLELVGTIDRSAFGLTWNAPLPGGGFLLPNEVALTASFSAVKAA